MNINISSKKHFSTNDFHKAKNQFDPSNRRFLLAVEKNTVVAWLEMIKLAR